jgi:hypothetical protein
MSTAVVLAVESITGEVASAVLAAVVGAFYDLHRHRDASTLSEKILAVVPRMIACDSALWVRVEPERQSFSFAAWPADRFAAVDRKEAASLQAQGRLLGLRDRAQAAGGAACQAVMHLVSTGRKRSMPPTPASVNPASCTGTLTARGPPTGRQVRAARAQFIEHARTFCR